MSEIKLLYQAKRLSQHQIMAGLNVSKWELHGTLNRIVETGSVLFEARSCRLKMTTASDDKYVGLCSLREEQLHHRYRKHNSPISKSTARVKLSSSGLRGRVPASKPLLRKENKCQWAQKRLGSQSSSSSHPKNNSPPGLPTSDSSEFFVLLF
uniref:Uncharacterized protein n=1 Tax=Anabas testudineus TaxID=64144 RepID=A0A7N6C137_ANATE